MKKSVCFLLFLIGAPAVSFCDNDFPLELFIPAITSAGHRSDNAQLVGAAGGTLKFANGLILSVPPGALTNTVAISLDTVDCSAIEPIIQAPAFSTLEEKRCLFGFAGKPDGLVFLIPATVTIPVSSLQAGETPIWTAVDEEAGTYRFPETDMIFRGQEEVVDVKIEHFSSKGVIAGKINQSVWSDELPDCCNTEDRIAPDCCCIQFEMTQAEGDIQSGGNCQDCQITGSVLSTVFPLCPGQPESYDAISESTVGCPKDLRPIIQSTDSEIWICQDLPLEAHFLGTNDDGSECSLPLPANWTLTAGSANASLTPQGPIGAILRGLSAGSVTVEATSTVDLVTRATKDVTLHTISGNWLEKFPEWSEICTMDGESWLETSGPDQAVYVHEQTCSTTTNTISSVPQAFPSSQPFEGSLVETGDPVNPFAFSMSYASSNSPDCRVFMDTNGLDIIFGEEICPPDAVCVALSCFESESASGTFSAANLARSITSESTGHFAASWVEIRDDGRVTRSISCDGQTTSTGQKL